MSDPAPLVLQTGNLIDFYTSNTFYKHLLDNNYNCFSIYSSYKQINQMSQ